MIYKLQQGGGIPPFAVYTPLPAAPVTNSQQDLNKDKKGNDDLINILKMLKEYDGMPNDINAIYDDVKKLISSGQEILSSGQINTAFLDIMKKANFAKFNSNLYKTVQNDIIAKGGLNEIAISERGFVLTYGENGNPKFITVDDYDPSKHHLLTNSEILKIRAENPNLAFNNGGLNIVSNGIGMNKVADMLEDFAKNLGSDSKTLEQATLNKDGKADSIKGGLKLLEEIRKDVDVSGVESIKGLHENQLYTKTQINQIKSASEYLMKMLPDNAKNLLKIKAKQQGTTIYNIVFDLFTSRASSEYKYTNSVKKADETSGEVDISKMKIDLAGRMILGKGDTKTTLIQNGTSDGLAVEYKYYQIMKTESQPSGPINARDLQGTYTGGLFNFNNAYIGDNKLNGYEFQKIMVHDNMVYIADLPISSSDSNKPELEYLKYIEKANDILKEAHNLDVRKLSDEELTQEQKQLINKVYKEQGMPFDKYNELGQRNMKFKRFGIFNVYYNTPKDLNLTEVDDKDEVHNMFKRGLSKSDSELVRKQDNYYKATMFVPLTKDKLAMSNYQNYTLGELNEIEYRIKKDEKIKQVELIKENQ